MATDNTAKLAKMMKTPEDALRAARLSQDTVNDIFRRARVARWQGLIFGLLSLALFVGSGLLVDFDGGRSHSIADLMFLGSFASFVALCISKGPKKIAAEATTAMQRRLVDLDRRCLN